MPPPRIKPPITPRQTPDMSFGARPEAVQAANAIDPVKKTKKKRKKKAKK